MGSTPTRSTMFCQPPCNISRARARAQVVYRSLSWHHHPRRQRRVPPHRHPLEDSARPPPPTCASVASSHIAEVPQSAQQTALVAAPHHPSPFTYAPTLPAPLLRSQFDLLAANDVTPSQRRRRTRKPLRGRRTGHACRRWRRPATAPRRSPSVTRGEQSSSRRRGRQRCGRGRAQQLGSLSTHQPSQSRDIPGMVARASSSLCESCEGRARVLWDALPLQVVRVPHRPCCPTRQPTTCSDPLFGQASASTAASP